MNYGAIWLYHIFTGDDDWLTEFARVKYRELLDVNATLESLEEPLASLVRTRSIELGVTLDAIENELMRRERLYFDTDAGQVFSSE